MMCWLLSNGKSIRGRGDRRDLPQNSNHDGRITAHIKEARYIIMSMSWSCVKQLVGRNYGCNFLILLKRSSFRIFIDPDFSGSRKFYKELENFAIIIC
jgi:hypothetical protein